MKRLVVIAFVMFAASAQARRVIHIPTIGELCPGNADWQTIAQCIRRQGTFELVRDEAKAKLVHVPAQSRFTGFYLYTHASQWTLRGELRLTQDHELLGFSRATFGAHTGYRIDVGVVDRLPFAIDEENSHEGVMRRQFAFVCFDDRSGCIEVMTACDVLVHGKAFYAFRGKLAYKDKQLVVAGDRALAGPYCAQPEIVSD